MLYTTIFGTNRHIQKATDHRLWKRITASPTRELKMQWRQAVETELFHRFRFVCA